MLSSINVVCCPVQASLGGRVRLMLTGAAPISPTVLTFLRAAIGCQVTQTRSSWLEPLFLCLSFTSFSITFLGNFCSALQQVICRNAAICPVISLSTLLCSQSVQHGTVLCLQQQQQLMIISIAFPLSQFYEGYGQTECTAGCTLTVPGDMNAGNK